jgi:diguanylate cyclase (GGDEF)-like protein
MGFFHEKIRKYIKAAEESYWKSEKKYRTQFQVPVLKDDLKHPETEREKELLVHIRKLTRLVHQDPMTGLLHKESFMTKTEQKYGGFYLFIDGDNLKETNLKYGHEAGHAIILGIAQGIKDVRPEFGKTLPLVTRAGGDEYMLYLEEKSLKKDVAGRWAGFILASINGIMIGDNYQGDDPKLKAQLDKMPISVSIGVGYTPTTAENAMKQAKATGKNKVILANDILQLSKQKSRYKESMV